MQFRLKSLALAVAFIGCLLATFKAGTYFPARTQRVPAVTGTKYRVPPGQAVQPPALLPGQVSGQTTAELGFGRMTVTPGPGRITIDGDADLWDSQGDKSYRWGLEVRELDSNHIALTVDYDHQLFTVPKGERQRPKFHDSCPLPPGTYNVRLDLYMVEGKQAGIAVSGADIVTIK